MSDIKNYPYFSYHHILDSLLSPITNQADVKLLIFDRTLPNREKFLVVGEQEHTLYYYSTEMYRYGLFEKDPQSYASGFHMWDHLPCDPNGIYERTRINYGYAHGLTIVQQHGSHRDTFVFVTKAGNTQINNFYLNSKDLFTDYMGQFYNTMAPTLNELSHHTFLCPGNTNFDNYPIKTLTSRQQDCAQLMAAGLTTKEIAKLLMLSPRTIEEHIDVLRLKFGAKNRTHLQYILQKYL